MTLKGEKVILRPITSKDIPLIIDWYKDPQIKALEFISGKIEEKDILNEKGKNFLIYGDGLPIGFINLDIVRINKWADIGILLGNPYWGKGYGKEAMKLIINYCFNTLKLNRVQLTTYSHNVRAQKFFSKVGFKTEGIRKEFLLYKGKYYDAIFMAILRKEWDKIKKEI